LRKSAKIGFPNGQSEEVPWVSSAPTATFLPGFPGDKTCQSELFSLVTPAGSAPMASVSAIAPKAARKSYKTAVAAVVFDSLSASIRSDDCRLGRQFHSMTRPGGDLAQARSPFLRLFSAR